MKEGIELEQLIHLSLDENLKRIVTTSLAVYRDQLKASATTNNKTLFQVIVADELAWIHQLLHEMNNKNNEPSSEILIFVHQPSMYERLTTKLKELQHQPTHVLTSITTQGESVVVKFNQTEQRYTILLNGHWICKTNRIDWAAHTLFSLLR